LPVNLKME